MKVHNSKELETKVYYRSSLVARILGFHCCGPSLISGLELRSLKSYGMAKKNQTRQAQCACWMARVVVLPARLKGSWKDRAEGGAWAGLGRGLQAMLSLLEMV